MNYYFILDELKKNYQLRKLCNITNIPTLNSIITHLSKINIISGCSEFG